MEMRRYFTSKEIELQLPVDVRAARFTPSCVIASGSQENALYPSFVPVHRTSVRVLADNSRLSRVRHWQHTMFC